MELRSIVVGPNEKTLAGIEAGRLRVVELIAGTSNNMEAADSEAETTCLAFDPEGALLVAGDARGRLRVWDMQSRTERRVGDGPASPAVGVFFTGVGTQAVTAHQDGTIAQWNGENASLHSQSRLGPNVQLTCFAIGPRGTIYLAGDRTGRCWLGSLERSESATSWSVSSEDDPVANIALTVDGRYALVRTLRWTSCWQFDEKRPLRLWKRRRLENPSPAESGAAPFASTFVTAENDGALRLVGLADGRILETIHLGPRNGRIGSLALSADGRYAFSANGDGSVYVVRLPERLVLPRLLD
jgi:WD40 repeat protein